MAYIVMACIGMAYIGIAENLLWSCAPLALLCLWNYTYKFRDPNSSEEWRSSGNSWKWAVKDSSGRQHEIFSTTTVILNANMIQLALHLQFVFLAVTQERGKCLVIREQVLLSALHPRPAEDAGAAVTLGDKLGGNRGAAVRRWLCTYKHALLGTVGAFAVLNWYVDWVGLRHHTAKTVADLTLAFCCNVLVVAMLLCNRISVTKWVLSKPSAWYFLICCTSAWLVMLVWRGPQEQWPWWVKIVSFSLLSASMLLIDALPVKTHAFFCASWAPCGIDCAWGNLCLAHNAHS